MAVFTDLFYLRIFALGGIQKALRSLPGPLLSMAGIGNMLIVIYHVGSVFNGLAVIITGNQNAEYSVIDTASQETYNSGKVSISPNTTLSWCGFSETGIPVTYDSLGILRALIFNENAWVPILDSKTVGTLANDSCWAVGVTKTHFMCVLCRGDATPGFPTPLIHDFAIRLPVVCVETEVGKLEEKYLLTDFRLLHGRLLGVLTADQNIHELEMDRHALHLILVIRF